MKQTQMKVTMLVLLTILAGLLTACGAAPAPQAAAPTTEPAAEVETPAAAEEPAAPAEGAEIKRIAMILPGRADDLAWNTAAYQGLENVKNERGVETTYVEDVQDADVERVLRDFASQGYELIIAHSYGYGDATLRVAQDFPDTYFLHGTAPGNADNVANYDIPSHEGGYLAGLLAGSMTESNNIGIVNSFDIPSMVMVSEAFKLGVKEVNPEATVSETFVGAWNDAPGGREAAEAQLDAGADFILAMGNHTGMGAIEAAEDRGVWAAGLYADQNELAPDIVLTSIVNRFDAIINAAIDDIAQGTFGNNAYLLTMREGAVELAPYHGLEDKIPEEVKAMLNETAEKILSGEIEVPIIETASK
ncbi:MAG TPA: BMP family protein [Anaerolineae bacterium]|nr:BMP family protein [Anaerolineae bacterium]